MAIIKCKCGSASCKIQIDVNYSENNIMITDKNGNETLMSLDANSIVEMTKLLKEKLIGLTFS
jgi:hypothetical protein